MRYTSDTRPGKSHHKGQIWSLDLISGITVMMILILLFIIEWNYFSVRWNTAAAYREMLSAALFASDALFTTPGDPPGWERLGNVSGGGVRTFGLADSRSMLDAVKLARLRELNASDADYYMALERIGMAGYQMHLIITDLPGESIYYEFGRPPELNNSVTAERLVLLNGTNVGRARVEVWG